MDTERAPASLVRNSSWLLTARVAGLLANVVVTVVAIRTLTTMDYGRFAFAITLVTLAISLSELGINSLATRRMVEDVDATPRLLGLALGAELVTSVFAACCLFVAAALIQNDARTILVIAIACGVVLLQGVLAALDSPFQASRLLRPVAQYGIVQAVVLLVVGTALLAAGGGAVGLMSATAAANGAAAMAALRGVRRLGIRPVWPNFRKDLGAFIRSAALIALTGTFATLYERVDLLLVAHYRGPTGVAFYSAALSIVVTLYVIPAAVSTAYYPLLSAQLRESHEAARRSFDLLFRVFLFASVPLALVLAFGAPAVVTTAFGERYRLSGDVLQLLAPILVLSFVNYICWQGLLAAHRERGKAAIVGVGLALNVALNCVLIPRYGVRGAAYSLLATEVLIVVAQGVFVHREVFRLEMRRLFGAPLVALAAAAAVAVASPLSAALLNGVLAAGAYTAVLMALRYVAPAEWQPVTEPIRALVARRRS